MKEAIEEFRQVAAGYCALVEAPQPDRLEYQEALMEMLPRLYLAASVLPHVEPETEELLPDRPTNDEWFAVLKRLQSAIGPGDEYRHVEPYPVKSREKPIRWSISDDLADIWKDLKQGLLALETGTPEADVVFHWRLEFTSHWGRHAVDALAAIHKFYW